MVTCKIVSVVDIPPVISGNDEVKVALVVGGIDNLPK